MLFDLTGTRHDRETTMQIDLIEFGVMGEEGTSLFPDGNPHTVSDRFARTLIHTGKAKAHVPVAVEEGPKKSPAAVQSRDPKAQHRDPR